MKLSQIKENFQDYTEAQRRALILISALAIGFALLLFANTRGTAIAQENPRPQLSISPVTRNILVHVAGKVKRPDVYPLLQGSRVADAIKAAGGAKKNVDLSDINLARILNDGEQIYIGQVDAPSKSTSRGASKAFNGIVNLNRATKSQLDSLVGIGPVIAARIIAYRNQNGSFMSVEDLLKVSGIGNKTLERIRARLTI